MSVISINKVSKSYGKVQAVSELNLQVNEGEIYGFIGPNGAGKSTTIRMLLNFISYDSGSISVLGFDPAREDIEIKKHTGYVASDTFMYSDMKVSELFRFTESFHGIKAGDRIDMLVKLLDIDTHKRFGQLSFGNRKKVSIACAMLHSPRLLILDEPSNGLDPVIRRNLYELLLEEKKKGVSIFFSSHVLHEVQRFCDRIGLIKDGCLIKESVASEFTDIGYRQVRIEAENMQDIAQLEGVAGFETEGRQCRFMYSGDMNRLIARLAATRVYSIHIEEPELENVFMHYFK
ncbi:MAG TPA: ABC transporter ATP-binding protein [Bacteroidales bacterium]|nr:ABC transporter ATP-binding protein [Bacteroidales bacterium]